MQVSDNKVFGRNSIKCIDTSSSASRLFARAAMALYHVAIGRESQVVQRIPRETNSGYSQSG